MLPSFQFARVDCSIKAYKVYSRRRAGRVYPHEIDIQETHTKHRKLDSQAALPHPTRDRPADGLRPHACGFKLANDGHDTRALQHYLGHKNIQHTVRCTEMAPDRFKNFWRGY